MTTYTLRCTVSRSHGSKRIEWDFEGKASGSLAFRAWRTMVDTGRTIDTDEPFRSAAMLKDGVVVESIGEAIIAA